jgi:repressor LexA
MSTTLTERQPLTERQQEVFEFIRDFRASKGYCCTVREVAQAVGSPNVTGAMCHLWPLRRKGWVTWENRQNRTIRPVGGDE